MNDVLAHRRDQVRQKYLEQVRKQVEVEGTPPPESQDAMEIGLRLGRRSGYGDGLVDGVALGMDTCLDVLDAILSQPTIAFGGTTLS